MLGCSSGSSDEDEAYWTSGELILHGNQASPVAWASTSVTHECGNAAVGLSCEMFPVRLINMTDVDLVAWAFTVCGVVPTNAFRHESFTLSPLCKKSGPG